MKQKITPGNFFPPFWWDFLFKPENIISHRRRGNEGRVSLGGFIVCGDCTVSARGFQPKRSKINPAPTAHVDNTKKLAEKIAAHTLMAKSNNVASAETLLKYRSLIMST